MLVGHSHAAIGETVEATRLLSSLEDSTNPQVVYVKEALSRRLVAKTMGCQRVFSGVNATIARRLSPGLTDPA